jgi:hypothetical protein
MNRKRTEFLERISCSLISDYIFEQGHCCDIPDGALITTFEYYDYSSYVKNVLVKGVMLLPKSNGQWSEDKLWFPSMSDAKFFVKWYNENKNTKAELVSID